MMCEASQSPKERRIPWGDNREIVIQKVNNERLGLSIEEKRDNKKVKFIIMDERNQCEWARLWRTFVVYACTVGLLGALIYFLVVKSLGVSWWWSLLPAVILGIGFLVQLFDTLYVTLREKCKRKTRTKITLLLQKKCS